MQLEQQLSRILAESHPEDAARSLERLEPEEAAEALASLPRDAAARVLRLLSPFFAAPCVTRFSDDTVASLLGELPVAVASRIVDRMAFEERERLLSRLPDELATRLRRSTGHAEGTAGALMDPGVIMLPQGITVAEALRRIRRDSKSVRFYIYVTDGEHRPIGALNLRELMLAPPGGLLGALMRRPVATVSIHARREGILSHPGWEKLHALPVVDGDGVLAGILRYETRRRLEAEAGSGPRHSPLAFGLALGEIYVQAASTLLDALFDVAQRRTRRQEHGEDRSGD